MYRSGSGGSSHGRHSYQAHSNGRSSHYAESGKRHHRESRREKMESYPHSSQGDEPPPGGSAGGDGGGKKRGGGFEMGVLSGSTTSNSSGSSGNSSGSSSRRAEEFQEGTHQWLQSSALQVTPPPVTPTYLSAMALTPPSKSECDVPMMGRIEGEKMMETQVTLWQEGWKAEPISCTIPKLHEPIPALTPAADATRASAAMDFPRDRDGNNLVLHCMGLQSYIQELAEMLSCLPEDSAMDSSGLESLPKKPTRFQRSSKLPAGDLLSLPAVPRLLNLNKQTLHKLQRKSTAAICSFTGYESSTPETLEILSDLLGSFLSNFTKFFKITADRTPGSGHGTPGSGRGCGVGGGIGSGGGEGCLGFHDALERSLQEMGMGGKSGLRQYWQASAVDYSRQLEMEADEYRNTYLRLTVPEERVQASTSMESTVSSPFANSRVFSMASPQEAVGEPEMALDTIMQQSRAVIAQRVGAYDIPPVMSLGDQETVPSDCESFVPLEVDGPPRKRIRTVSLEHQ